MALSACLSVWSTSLVLCSCKQSASVLCCITGEANPGNCAERQVIREFATCMTFLRSFCVEATQKAGHQSSSSTSINRYVATHVKHITCVVLSVLPLVRSLKFSYMVASVSSYRMVQSSCVQAVVFASYQGDYSVCCPHSMRDAVFLAFSWAPLWWCPHKPLLRWKQLMHLESLGNLNTVQDLKVPLEILLLVTRRIKCTN